MNLGAWGLEFCFQPNSTSLERLGGAEMSDAGLPERLRLGPGDERRYVLPTHGGGGYRWHSRVEGESVRVTIAYEDALPVRDLPGPVRSVGQVVAIIAVREGTAAVLLQERRSWETEAAATRRIEVQVRSADEWEEE